MVIIGQHLRRRRRDQLHPRFYIILLFPDAKGIAFQRHILRLDEHAVIDAAGFVDNARLMRRSYLDMLVRESALEGIDDMSALAHKSIQSFEQLVGRRV
ncbi:hypothetical protein D3C77_523670 [compost metagenome]